MVQRIADSLYRFFLRVTGNRIFKKILHPVETRTMTAIGINGYGVVVSIRKIRFEYYSPVFSWWRSHFCVFEIQASPQPKVPDVLRQVLDEPTVISLVVPGFISSELEFQLVLDAYLDLVIQKLK